MFLQVSVFYFLWFSNTPVCVSIHLYPRLTCSSVDGHLGCFHVLAVVHSAAVDTGVHVSFQITFFSRYVARGEIAGSSGCLIVVF